MALCCDGICEHVSYKVGQFNYAPFELEIRVTDRDQNHDKFAS